MCYIIFKMVAKKENMSGRLMAAAGKALRMRKKVMDPLRAPLLRTGGGGGGYGAVLGGGVQLNPFAQPLQLQPQPVEIRRDPVPLQPSAKQLQRDINALSRNFTQGKLRAIRSELETTITALSPDQLREMNSLTIESVNKSGTFDPRGHLFSAYLPLFGPTKEITIGRDVLNLIRDRMMADGNVSVRGALNALDSLTVGKQIKQLPYNVEGDYNGVLLFGDRTLKDDPYAIQQMVDALKSPQTGTVISTKTIPFALTEQTTTLEEIRAPNIGANLGLREPDTLTGELARPDDVVVQILPQPVEGPLPDRDGAPPAKGVDLIEEGRNINRMFRRKVILNKKKERVENVVTSGDYVKGITDANILTGGGGVPAPGGGGGGVPPGGGGGGGVPPGGGGGGGVPPGGGGGGGVPPGGGGGGGVPPGGGGGGGVAPGGGGGGGVGAAPAAVEDRRKYNCARNANRAAKVIHFFKDWYNRYYVIGKLISLDSVITEFEGISFDDMTGGIFPGFNLINTILSFYGIFTNFRIYKSDIHASYCWRLFYANGYSLDPLAIPKFAYYSVQRYNPLEHSQKMKYMSSANIEFKNIMISIPQLICNFIGQGIPDFLLDNLSDNLLTFMVEAIPKMYLDLWDKLQRIFGGTDMGIDAAMQGKETGSEINWSFWDSAKRMMWKGWEILKAIGSSIFIMLNAIWTVLKGLGYIFVDFVKSFFTVPTVTPGEEPAERLQSITARILYSIFQGLKLAISVSASAIWSTIKILGYTIFKTILWDDRRFIFYVGCRYTLKYLLRENPFNILKRIQYGRLPYKYSNFTCYPPNGQCPPPQVCDELYQCVDGVPATPAKLVTPTPVNSYRDLKEEFTTAGVENTENTENIYDESESESESEYKDFFNFCSNKDNISFEEFTEYFKDKVSDTNENTMKFRQLDPVTNLILLKKFFDAAYAFRNTIYILIAVQTAASAVRSHFEQKSEVSDYDKIKVLLNIVRNEDIINDITNIYTTINSDFENIYEDTKDIMTDSNSYGTGGDPSLLCSNNYNINNDSYNNIDCSNNNYTIEDDICDYDSGCYQVGICNNSGKIACQCPPIVNKWKDNIDISNLDLNRWYTTYNNCTENPGCYKVYTTLDNMKICGCCPRVSDNLNTNSDVKTTNRQQLTLWLKSKINELKTQLDIIISASSGWYNNQFDKLRVRSFNIYLKIIILITKLYQEFILIGDSKSGKPWDNINGIIEMCSFIASYLPFVKIQIEHLHFIYLNNLYWIPKKTNGNDITTLIVGTVNPNQINEESILTNEGYIYTSYDIPSITGPIYHIADINYSIKILSPESFNNKFDYNFYTGNDLSKYINLEEIFKSIQEYIGKRYNNPRGIINDIELISGLNSNNFLWPSKELKIGSLISDYGVYKKVCIYNGAEYEFKIPGSEIIDDNILCLYPYILGTNYSNWENLILYDGETCKDIYNNTTISKISDTYLLFPENSKKYNINNLKSATSILGPDATNYYILPDIIKTGKYYIRAIDNNGYYWNNINGSCSYLDNYISLTTTPKLFNIYRNSDGTYYISNGDNNNEKYLYFDNSINDTNDNIIKLYYLEFNYDKIDNFKFILNNMDTDDGSIIIQTKLYNINIITIQSSQEFIPNSSPLNFDGLVLPTNTQFNIFDSLLNKNMRYDFIPSDIYNQTVGQANTDGFILTIKAHKPYSNIGDYNSDKLFYYSNFTKGLSFENTSEINSGEKVIVPESLLKVKSWSSETLSTLQPVCIYANSYTNNNTRTNSTNIYGEIIFGRWIRIGFLDDNDSSSKSFTLSQIIIYNELGMINIDPNRISTNGEIEEISPNLYSDSSVPSDSSDPTFNYSKIFKDTKEKFIQNNPFKVLINKKPFKHNFITISGIKPYIEIDLVCNYNINMISFISYSESIKNIKIEVINDYFNGLKEPISYIKNLLEEDDLLDSSSCNNNLNETLNILLDSSSSKSSDDIINIISDKLKNEDSSLYSINDIRNKKVFRSNPITGIINNNYVFTPYSKCASIYENNINPVKTGICYPEAIITGKYIFITKSKSYIEDIIIYDYMYNKIDFVDVYDSNGNYKVSIGPVENNNNVKISNIIILTKSMNIGETEVKVMKYDNTVVYSNRISGILRYEYSFNYYNNMLSNQFVHKTPVFDCSKVPAQHFVTISRYIRSGLLTYLYAITDIRLVLLADISNSPDTNFKKLLPNALTNENSVSEKYLKSNTNILNGLYEFGPQTTITPTYTIAVEYSQINTHNMNNIQIITDISIANNNYDITIYENPRDPDKPLPKFSIIKKPFSQLEEGEKFLVSACYLTKKYDVVTSVYEKFNLIGGSSKDKKNQLMFNGSPMIGKDIIFNSFSNNIYYKEGISGIGVCYNMFTESMFYHSIDNTYNPNKLPPEYCNA